MKKVAIIPARGGSKRIPGKNKKIFFGKPMIAWSITAAKNSGCFDRVIVSTDDDEIAKVAKEYGAEVPFVRPKALSDDFTTTAPVIRHAIEWLKESMYEVEYVCCIYATAPFLTEEDLIKGLYLIEENLEINYVFSATSYAFPIQRAFRINESNQVEMFEPGNFKVRSQDLDEAWHDAGQFYWGRAGSWLKELPIFAQGSVPVKLPRHRVQDVDTQEDWERAEWLFKAIAETNGKFS